MKQAPPILAVLLLLLMAILAGGAALRESITVDEVAHIGAGLSYLQKLDLRLNQEHPPLAKVLAALPLVLRGVRADPSDTLLFFAGTIVSPRYGGHASPCLRSLSLVASAFTCWLPSWATPGAEYF